MFIIFFYLVLILFITSFNFNNSFPFYLFSFWLLYLLFPTCHAHSSSQCSFSYYYHFLLSENILFVTGMHALEYTTIITDNSAFFSPELYSNSQLIIYQEVI